MASRAKILRDVVIEIDGVELSDRASRVAINLGKDQVDVTTFGNIFRAGKKGLGDASIDITFFQGFDAAGVDDTLYPLFEDDEATFEVLVKADSGPVGPTNPAWRMAEAMLPDYTPLSGGVGDASTIDVRFQNAGQTGVVRVTA